MMMLTCSQPAGAVKSAAETAVIAEVVLRHHLRTSDVYFTVLVTPQASPRPHIDHLQQRNISVKRERKKTSTFRAKELNRINIK